jgi:putative PIN family toxin of toxin-antitoxin system
VWLLKSATTEAQLLEVIARPRLAPLIAPATLDWLRKLAAVAELVTITERIAACRDSTDDKCLELAVNGCADLILAGDNDLAGAPSLPGIPIVAPVTFMQGAPR